MEEFIKGQRVQVTSKTHPCFGEAGTVVRCRGNNNWAWVRMDRELTGNLRSFPADDPRKNDVLFDAGECDEMIK